MFPGIEMELDGRFLAILQVLEHPIPESIAHLAKDGQSFLVGAFIGGRIGEADVLDNTFPQLCRAVPGRVIAHRDHAIEVSSQ